MLGEVLGHVQPWALSGGLFSIEVLLRRVSSLPVPHSTPAGPLQKAPRALGPGPQELGQEHKKPGRAIGGGLTAIRAVLRTALYSLQSAQTRFVVSDPRLHILP